MIVNSSLQQIAGGIAAAVGGLIVTQKTKTSPLEHYNTLGDCDFNHYLHFYTISSK